MVIVTRSGETLRNPDALDRAVGGKLARTCAGQVPARDGCPMFGMAGRRDAIRKLAYFRERHPGAPGGAH